MDKSTKYYKKAVEYYNEGYLEKSLYFCEKSISNNLRSSAAVNLKGLLFYLKGDLSEVEALWKLNYDYNKDQVAKKYLDNLKMDRDKVELYSLAQRAIEKMDFKEALRLLEECAASDFNAIMVNNSLCTAYMHMGRYEEAKKCIKKVLSIDKNDKISRENTNMLIDYGVINRKSKKTGFIAIFIIASATYLITMLWGKYSKSDTELSQKNNTVINKEILTGENKDEVKNETSVKEHPSTEEQAPAEENVEVFPKEQFSNAINSKSYRELFNLLASSSMENLDASEKEIYLKGKLLMANEGVTFLYNKGRELHLKGRELHLADKIQEALEQYLMAENYAEGSHLYPSIIFMSGDCYEFLNNREKAIEYYTKYLGLNSKSGYEETVLYQLMLIYKDSDIKMAKKYANEIVNRYKGSDFNNSIVEAVIKAQ